MGWKAVIFWVSGLGGVGFGGLWFGLWFGGLGVWVQGSACAWLLPRSRIILWVWGLEFRGYPAKPLQDLLLARKRNLWGVRWVHSPEIVFVDFRVWG